MSRATKRLAVVLGNSDYENLTSLTNSTNDAKAINEVLHSLGYEVVLGINLQRSEILRYFKNIMDSWKHEASEIVIYYSGHGIFIDGKAYIAPVDADNDTSEDFGRESFLSIEIIMWPLLKYRKDDNFPIILILDCCRSEVISNHTHGRDPLQNIKGEFGTVANIAILYSTADGQIALDGHNGSKHSPYTQILLENIMKDWTIYEINNTITRTLGKSSRFSGKQVSWMYQCLYEPYRFSLPKSVINSQELSPTLPASGGCVMYHFYGVPPKNNNFTDRPDIISKMETSISEGASSNGSNILALKGLGGMGKTQLMLRYCYLHHAKYDYTFWLEADGKITTLDSFRKLSINLGLDEDSAKKKYTDESIIDWVSAWLQKKSRWLLLLDNVDEVMATKVFEILPRIGGDIILTTREYIPSSKARVISVDKMNEDEALSLLLLLRNVQSFDSIDRQNEKYSKEIVAELDSMPLAIALACAYINDMQISFEDYFSMLKNQYDEVFSHFDEDNSCQYNHTLTTVWKLSFERVRTRYPIAGLILDICAFLQPDAIPVSFFERQYFSFEHQPALASSESSEFLKAVRTAIAVLVKFSFVTRISREDAGQKKDFLVIHRLVQKVIFNAMSDEKRICYAYNIATALNNEVEISDHYSTATREIMNMYLSHIRHFTTLLNDISSNPFLSKDLEDLLLRTVQYLLDNGIYVGVESLAKRAVSISESIHGPNDLSTTESLYCLAKLYKSRGIYSDAERLYQQAHIIRKKTLGPDHPSMAASLNNLAGIYFNQGNYGKAEPLYEQALAISEKALGPEHPSTATSLNNLAGLYFNQGNYGKAEPLYERALAIKEKVLGPKHLDTTNFLNNLASLYKIQGKYADAERLYQRALIIRENTLGPEHPDTANTLNNLASLYSNQCKYVDAEPLYQRALTIKEKILGPEHPGTAGSLHNLAFFYKNQGRYSDAEPLYQRALIIRENVLGPEHPDTANTLNNLASLYKSQGKYIDAEPLYQRALTIKEKVLGIEHPDTAGALYNLASFYKDQGKYANAEPLYQRLLTIRENTLGPEHPDIASPLNNLASLYRSQSKYANAEPLYKRALKICESALGHEHPGTATSLHNLASLHFNQGKYAEAQPLYRRALTIYERVLGSKHPHAKLCRNMLSYTKMTNPLWTRLVMANSYRNAESQ